MPEQHPYHCFLNGWNPESPTDGTLTRLALEDIRKSGLGPEILERAQVRLFNEKSTVLRERLGIASIDGNPILRAHRVIEFPYPDEMGIATRYEYKPFPAISFKNDNEPRKYLQKKGHPATPYIIPEVWAARDKATKPLYITEGVKKTLSLIQYGRLTIGVSGVWNFRAGKDNNDPDSKELWGSLESFKWTGRTVYIAFDNDLWINPHVRNAMYQLSFILYLRGAALKYPEWQGAKGIDDYISLASDPHKALKELEDQAKDLETVICTNHRNEIMDALYHMPGKQGINERTLTEIIAKGLGQKAKDIKYDLARMRHSKLKQTVDNSLYPFFINEAGGVSMWRRERDGNEAQADLCNFTARITEDVTIDNGLEISRRFTIEGRSHDKTFPQIRLKAIDFQSMNWVLPHWGTLPVIRAGNNTRDLIREFVLLYSNHCGVKKRAIWGHTGWKEIHGTWAYLMANGAIGADNIDVELQGDYLETGRYCLPKTIDNEEQALNMIPRFLSIGKPEIFYPCLAYVFLSPLTSLLDPMPAFTLYLYGEKDSLKTTIAVLMLAFFGKHTRRGLSNLDSTANAVMQRAAVLKDTLMVVDDYYPSSRLRDAQQKESIAQRIIRDAGNRTGRGRLNPDSTEKAIPFPRGMIAITGEELPALQSTLSRIVAVECIKKEIDLKELTKVQELAGLLPQTMVSFIVWLKDRTSSMQDAFLAELYQLRKTEGIENTSMKLNEHLIYLRFAWKILWDWIEDRGAVTGSLKQAYVNKGYDIFNSLVERNTRRVESEDPVGMFFEIVGTLLIQGDIRLDHKDSSYGGGHIGGNSGKIVGYYDDIAYYLLPTPLWHSVQNYLYFENARFPFSKTTLYETLERRGLLEARGGKRSHALRIGSNIVSALKLKRGEGDVFNGLSVNM